MKLVESRVRPRFQYTLRSLMIVVLLFSLACSCLAVRLRAARRQALAVASLRQAGFVVYYDDEVDGNGVRRSSDNRDGPLVKLLGVDFFAKPVEVLAALSGGGSFRISFWSDSDTTHVGGLRELRSLRYIDLRFTNLTDSGVNDIKDLPDVKALRVGNTKVTDAGLASIAEMASLRELDITNSQVSDNGLAQLRRLQGLTKLGVGGPSISDRGIANIASLNGLLELNIETRLVMPQNPDGTFPTVITEEAVRSLRRQLPNCKITLHADCL